MTETRPPRRWLVALIVCVALAALAGGALLAVRYRHAGPPPQIGGYVLPEPQALPAVALVDEHGRTFGPADFAGHWSFVYFGYTYCPDVCPLTLVKLADLKKRLAQTLPGTAAEYYLISVDPARDTPDRLRDYVTYFDPGFHGLTGGVPDLTSLAQATGSVFFVPEGQSQDTYLVSHSSNITLLDPKGRLYAVFTQPQEPAQLAADFAAIVAYDARR